SAAAGGSAVLNGSAVGLGGVGIVLNGSNLGTSNGTAQLTGGGIPGSDTPGIGVELEGWSAVLVNAGATIQGTGSVGGVDVFRSNVTGVLGQISILGTAGSGIGAPANATGVDVDMGSEVKATNGEI